MIRHSLSVILLLVFGLIAFGIVLNKSRGPRTMHVEYGKSVCAYCNMLLQEQAFGAELELTEGGTLEFDATECLVAHLVSKRIPEAAIQAFWAVDHDRPSVLVDGRSACYVRSDRLVSPMSLNVAAFSSVEAAEQARSQFGGERLDWPGVQALVRARWHLDELKK